ncbi:MAG: hypothetical protein LBV59_02800 [Sphingobacterium sp.]|jgi:hypothetical protein|uniref:hypothetical protein n=1 Tax=Sphingobacterium sp. TaxID=341027 RepID=UPI00284700A0|nr:hypothetical protein [Sphingobacterium sp.]MDR3006833.1 hypothetical protein [Sphingobacterium sp.]
MKSLEYIPNLWFRIRAVARIFLRKLTYSFSGKDVTVKKFTNHAANKKGLLIIKYECDGLLYTEILSKKYFNLSNTIILNLEKIGNDIPLEVSFVGLRNRVVEKITVDYILQTDFGRFKSEINLKKLEMTDFRLAQSKNTLRYRLNNTAITIKSPKLKFR